MKQEIYDILNAKSWGVLSTSSFEMNGCPVGSVASYVMLEDEIASPHFCLSDISEHTINFKKNNQVSLMVWTGDEKSPQKLARVTWIGHMEPAKEHARQTLFELPQFKSYLQFHDFNAWVLKLERIRYIGGFASAHWVEKEKLYQQEILIKR